MTQLPYFDPLRDDGAEPPTTGELARRGGDQLAPYVYEDPIVLAINVALATGRPLLLLGPPGCGKSTLAADVARRLGRRYHEAIISSRTRARDLQWHFDAVHRLADAQAGRGRHSHRLSLERYVEPRALWWAFDPASAVRHGLQAGHKIDVPLAAQRPGSQMAPRAVLLVDEIDKAEPDVPNDLLVPLGTLRFTVEETGLEVCAVEAPFVVITSNNERDLSAAFMRRCVLLRLEVPKAERHRAIARAHFPLDRYPRASDSLIARVVEHFEVLSAEARQRKLRGPGTAELLDAILACVELDVNEGSPVWRAITDAALWKHPESRTDNGKGKGKEES